MRIVEPKAQIVDNDWPIERKLAWAAAICYDKQDSIAGLSDDECLKKVQNYYDRGHMSVLEMHRMKIKLFSSGLLSVAKNEYRGTPWVDFRGRIMVASLRVLLESQAPELRALGKTLLQHDGDKAWPLPPAYRLSSASLGVAEPVMVRVECSLNIATQIVRHRPCSFLQMSQRYTDMSDLPVIIPDVADKETGKVMLAAADYAETTYKTLRDQGLKRQAARFVLPNMTATKLLVLTSVHHWRHIFRLRCDKAADPEMQRIMIPLEAEFNRRGLI